MEDQRRELDSPKKEIPPLKEKSLNPKEMTVMIIRSVGKIRSFKISRHVIIWPSIFLLAYILLSLFIFNRFFNLRYQYNIQAEKLADLESKFNKNETLLIKTKQYVAGLEDYIQNLTKESSDSSVSTGEDKAAQKENPVIIATAGKTLEEGEKTLNNVEIKDVTIVKESDGIIFDFKLVNTHSEENASEGYVHIIAMDNNNDFPTEWNFPHDKLNDNGIPLNYRNGQPFFIQRFKPYHRQFNLNSNSILPAAIKVLVYDRSGNLIFKNEFEVDNES